MKLFLASTNEQLKLAKALASRLSRSGYDMIRWWRAFRSGDLTVDRLMEMANSVDGAIFILDAADKGTTRGNEYAIPRDNLLFEYGLFMNRLVKG